MRKIIVITGQTATGKTQYALDLAKKNNGDLISADSRQIYKYLDIVTGKDVEIDSKCKVQNAKLQLKIKSLETNYFLLNNIRLWGLDIITPDQAFSSSQYVQYVLFLINNFVNKDKSIIIVGGTYLYIKHLIYGVKTEGIKPNWKLRKQLDKSSVKQLQKRLTKIDIKLFNQMNQSDQNNPRRLIRKIEIASSSITKLLALNNLHTKSLNRSRDYRYKLIGLKFKKRDSLISTITKRVKKRLKDGAVNETEKLLKIGYKKTDPGLSSIGYRQIINYLAGEIDYQKMVNLWITAEVQYARRQYTFMKKDKNIVWIQV